MQCGEERKGRRECGQESRSLGLWEGCGKDEGGRSEKGRKGELWNLF